MMTRCYNPNDPRRWKYYGGKGITVCPRWVESFSNFFADMGFMPPGKSLDRKDSGGNYDPGNCRWADQKTQVHNSSATKLSDEQVSELRERYARGGVTHQRLADEMGVARGTVTNIINRARR